MLLLLNHHIWWVSAHSILNKLVFKQQSNYIFAKSFLDHSKSESHQNVSIFIGRFRKVIGIITVCKKGLEMM